MTNSHAHRTSRYLYTTLALLVGALALSLSAGASNTTLRASVDKWSRTIGVDANSVSLAATHRHPRRMTSSALRFRHDALRARAAIAAQRPSTANGRKARALALQAFASYATAGSRWAATGRARLAKQRSLARRSAIAAATSARAGNRLLVSVTRLLR